MTTSTINEWTYLALRVRSHFSWNYTRHDAIIDFQMPDICVDRMVTSPGIHFDFGYGSVVAVKYRFVALRAQTPHQVIRSCCAACWSRLTKALPLTQHVDLRAQLSRSEQRSSQCDFRRIWSKAKFLKLVWKTCCPWEKTETCGFLGVKTPLIVGVLPELQLVSAATKLSLSRLEISQFK